MEYEIESETVLFDPSTNPSLDRRRPRPARDRLPQDKRRLQKAEVIPDEEEQAISRHPGLGQIALVELSDCEPLDRAA